MIKPPDLNPLSGSPPEDEKDDLQKLREIGERLPDPGLVMQLFEASTDGVMVINSEGKISLANAAAESLFGYPRAELYEQAVDRFLPVEMLQKKRPIIDHFQADKFAASMGSRELFNCKHRDGTDLSVQIFLTSIATSGGLVTVANIRKNDG